MNEMFKNSKQTKKKHLKITPTYLFPFPPNSPISQSAPPTAF
jgi:hypothetical protein